MTITKEDYPPVPPPPNLKSLGSGDTKYEVYYNPTLLESFSNPQQKHEYTIEIKAPEFTCLCPKTGQPDFATIEITYSPDTLCVESKSLKLYLFSFRNSGAFHEDVTNRIAADLFNFLRPHWINVIGRFYPRGGISFQPHVRLQKEMK
jgi:7-cyano-7-deazaguanine reductase